MATYTPNYGLHQWEPEDDFLRTDFNTDLGIIDSALGQKSKAVIGSYVGTGATEHTITLGFPPKFMLIVKATPQESRQEKEILYVFGTSARFDRDDGRLLIAPHDNGSGLILYSFTPTSTGMILYSVAAWDDPSCVMNRSGETYQYVAVG